MLLLVVLIVSMGLKIEYSIKLIQTDPYNRETCTCTHLCVCVRACVRACVVFTSFRYCTFMWT